MPRPTRCRRIERLPVYRSFSPDDAETAESVRMTVDEFEALRPPRPRAPRRRLRPRKLRGAPLPRK
ncbi:MAG: DUF134 domain-containing protein [Ruminococcaceae bacterium]|nr:DUF134 domain-containing protein [Oscillospiraceae bacterium]